ncbi:MAG: hypothetical protein R2715_08010 [Ilumatobacteraceae bacterium]
MLRRPRWRPRSRRATPSGGSGRQKLGIAMVVVSLLAAAGIWAAQRAAFAGSVKNLALEQDPG